MSDRLEVGSMVAGFAGAVLSPGEPWYDDARAIFNSMIDRRSGPDRALREQR